MNCPFCGIVAGNLPSRTVYEDDHVRAFLDSNPLARGHTLVVPTSHYETVGDMPTERAEDLFAAVARLTPAVERAADADATTVGMNNGRAAGQEVPHAHVHIVPRERGDRAGPLHALDWPRPDLGDDALDEVAGAIVAEQE